MAPNMQRGRVTSILSRRSPSSPEVPESDFIDIARRELDPGATSSETRARIALFDLFLQAKFRQTNRRPRLRAAILEIAGHEGFDSVISAGRDIVRLWRTCAEEVESTFHHVRDLYPQEDLAHLSQASLTSRIKPARDQLDRALTGATPNASHRKYEVSRAMQLCIEHFGYDASYIAAHKQVGEFRTNANELESILSDLLFDDVCSHTTRSRAPLGRIA
jgi:hypothetical protein